MGVYVCFCLFSVVGSGGGSGGGGGGVMWYGMVMQV